MSTLAYSAILDSIAESRIVHLKWSLGLERDLLAASDAMADMGETLEFWGACEGHGTWQVHLDAVPRVAAELRAILDSEEFPARVERLRREAGEAGDLAQVAVCTRALMRDHTACAECARVLLAAQAMG